VAIWPKRKPEASAALEIPSDAPIDSLRYVVLDTELTSLEHRTNRLLSVGAIGMQGASIVLGEQFYRMVNPEVEIPAESVVIHQIRSEDVKGAENISKTFDELSQFIRGAVLVGHFAHIDLKILRKEMAETGHGVENPAIDTARVHQWLLRQGRYSEDLALQLEKLDLETVAKSYGLDRENAHHALGDAFLTAQLWQKMLIALQRNGVSNLKKLLKIGAAK
jgi:DNA polymerase III subunit epsilon